MAKKQLDAVDLTKFVSALFVLAIHSNPFLDLSAKLDFFISNGVARLAVPFFFTISAYFFFLKETTKENTIKYCKRLLILYLVWFIVSLPKTIMDRIVFSEYPLKETIFRFVRSFFVTSTFSGSWFIVSCIFCAVLFYFLEKLPSKTRVVLTIIISAIVYLWCVFTSEFGVLYSKIGMSAFYNVYELVLGKPYVSFLVGVPYYALGRYFAKQENISNGKYIKSALAIPLIIVLLFEIYISYTYKLSLSADCYFMLMPIVFLTMPAILSADIHIKNSKFLRASSTIIFFSQFLVLYALEFLEYALSINILYVFKFCIALTAGLLLSLIILKLQNVKGFKWLKYFY
ncbi:MAG: acyltransferase family protein [Clostridia bacterium]|nr:acyltransferase family protein [Clostridia bacterium]